MADRGSELEPDEDPATLDSFTQSVTSSGSGDGVSFHIDSERARRYNLTPGDELDVTVESNDGKVYFRLGLDTVGFDLAQLEQMADTHGWNETDRTTTPAETRVTYVDEWGAIPVQLRVTDADHADATPVVITDIRGPRRKLTPGHLDAYEQLREQVLAKDIPVNVELQDSDGYWGQLQLMHGEEVAQPPDRQTVSQLLGRTDWVEMQLHARHESTATSITDVFGSAAEIKLLMFEFDEAVTSGAAAQEHKPETHPHR
jgi:hypothetical protein